VYNRGGSLFAASFDLARGEVVGPAVPVLQDVSAFTVSANGTAVYRAAAATPAMGLFLVDGGKSVQTLAVAGGVRSVRLSPDGRRVAYGGGWNGGGIAVYDLTLGTHVRVLPDGWNGCDPFWTLDGRSVAFHSSRPGVTLLFAGFVVPADGGEPRELFNDANVVAPQSWLPDGRLLARGNPPRPGSRGSDLFVLEFSGDSAAVTPYLRADWDESNAHASPDGRWIAFRSDETGRQEVYVRPFPDAGAGKWQISENGGNDPTWSRDGNTVFYWEGQQLRAARLRTRPAFAVVSRETVLTDSLYAPSCCFPNYDVYPDGRRFLIARRAPAQADAPNEIVIVVNWFEQLKARMANTPR